MASASGKFNVRNPAVKRIMQEIKELQSEACPHFIAEALEEDIFEWHFVIRGPSDTEFEGGIFHGRILLPAEYPFKPPAFMMLTPNGRFQTGTKICLSISSHHPEHWQPSWSVRTALTALIAFMPTPGQGAIGSLDFTKEERMQLAAKSRCDIPKFGSAARQKVTSDMHTRFLELQTSHATAATSSGSSPAKPAAAAAATGVLRDVQSPSRTAVDQGAIVQDSDSKQQEQELGKQQQLQPVFSLQQQQQQRLSQASSGGGSSELLSQSAAAAAAQDSTQHLPSSPPAAAAAVQPFVGPTLRAAGQQQHQQLHHALLQQQLQQHPQQQRMAMAALGGGAVSDSGDRGLAFLIVVLSVAIVAMLLKKVVVAFGDVRPPML